MWIKDCKEGSIVVKTYKHLTELGCDLICKKEPECKTFLYDEDGSNCVLTTATEGTSLANGISGNNYDPSVFGFSTRASIAYCMQGVLMNNKLKEFFIVQLLFLKYCFLLN